MRKWSLFREGGRWVIRRWQDGKYLRLSRKNYRHINDNESELRAFVLRLNEREFGHERVKEVVLLKHAFISPKLIDEYYEERKRHIATEGKAETERHYLVTHFLNFFIGQKNLKDPLDWHRVHKILWHDYLVNDCPLAPDTKREIIQAANRFISWLADKKYYRIEGNLRFEPISKTKFAELDAQREDKGIGVRRVIADAHWELIRASLPADIRSSALIAYYYGLRLAEIGGLELDNVREDYLAVKRQRKRLEAKPGRPEFTRPKWRRIRNIPHLFTSPSDAYNWVKTTPLMLPSTLGRKWAKYMKSLGLDYKFHEIRHTFVTKVARLPNMSPARLMEIAGHKDLRTTNQYLHAINEESKRFVPKAS